jgi:mRNA interferase MazF
MRRGEIYRVRQPGDDPKSHRSFVVVSLQTLIDSRFSTVICAPIFSRGHGFSTQIAVGIAEGMKHDSWILCDNLISLRKAQLTDFVGRLPSAKIADLNRALKIALAIDKAGN